MFPKYHIIFGLFFSVLVYLIFSITLFQTILIFLSSFLIDFDHYLWAANRTKSLKLKKNYNHFKKICNGNHKPIMAVFHTVEFIILVLILSFFYNPFLFILIGMLFHSIIDIVYFIIGGKFRVREFSLIKYLISDKNNYF